MTRQDIISTLRDLMTGTLQAPPPSWHVDAGSDGNLSIVAEGERFDVDVRSSNDDRRSTDDVFGSMTQEERDAFARSLDEAADEAEREGPVPAEELRRSLDDAIQSGLRMRDEERRAAE